MAQEVQQRAAAGAEQQDIAWLWHEQQAAEHELEVFQREPVGTVRVEHALQRTVGAAQFEQPGPVDQLELVIRGRELVIFAVCLHLLR